MPTLKDREGNNRQHNSQTHFPFSRKKTKEKISFSTADKGLFNNQAQAI